MVTGFWVGFWSLLLLMIGSWLIGTSGTDRAVPRKSDRLSLFKPAALEPGRPTRGVAGQKIQGRSARAN